jgi:dehydrogenase/reductase SDR family member 12
LKHVTQYSKDEPVQSQAVVLPVKDNSSNNNNTTPSAVDDDGVDLTGKVICITGANSGLGEEVARYVASKHAKLYMLCRSADRAQQARQKILSETGASEEDVQVVLVDVAELESVRKAAQQLQANESQIHCLVCNAGVLHNAQQNSGEGIEATFASHLLGGTYLLASLLLAQLEAADDSRVVVVTSGGMYNTALPPWEVLTSYTTPPSPTAKDSIPPSFKYSGNMAYAYAKRGQVVLVEEWSRLYGTKGKAPKFVAVHPGWADTPAVEEAYGEQKKWLEPMREPWQGAEGIAWLTATKGSNLESGALYLDRKPQRKHLAGPFFSEGSFTKNKPEEIQEFMKNLKQAAGLE